MQLSELGYLGKAIMQQLVSFFSQLQRVSATVLSDEITMLCSSTAKSPEPCSVAVALNAIGRSKVTALALGYLGKAIMQQLVSFFSQLQRVSATVLSDEITMLCSSTAKSPEPCSVAVALNAIGRSKVTARAQATNINAL
jgi:DNA-binding FrmR family transcriptional regulator